MRQLSLIEDARWRRALTEAIGVLAALSLGTIVLAHLATSPRSWILFYDGDSVLPLLVQGSMRVGQTQDWALSSPLFVLEAVLYVPLLALDLPSRTTMLILGGLNWLAFYAGARSVAWALRLPSRAGVASALLVQLAMSLLASCDSSADRNALELASLLSTTTYYAPTIATTTVLVALCAAVLGAPSSRSWLPLAGVVVISTLSNPIAIAWGVVPAAFVGGIVAWRFGLGSRWMRLVLTMGVAVSLGMIARVPFWPMLVQNIDDKIQPARAQESALYYLRLAGAQLNGPAGWIELIVFGVLLSGAGSVFAVCLSSRWVAGAFISGVAVLGPLIVILGAILTGTFAARYLQPVAFLPALGLIPACGLAYEPLKKWAAHHGGLLRVCAACHVPLFTLASLAAMVTLLRVSTQTDPSVACVVDWVEGGNRTGAGEFWTIRAPKSELRDPRRLIQIDAQFNEYPWLVNRADFDDYDVTFLVREATSTNDVPDRPGTNLIRCGRYTIVDLGSESLSAH